MRSAAIPCRCRWLCWVHSCQSVAMRRRSTPHCFGDHAEQEGDGIRMLQEQNETMVVLPCRQLAIAKSSGLRGKGTSGRSHVNLASFLFWYPRDTDSPLCHKPAEHSGRRWNASACVARGSCHAYPHIQPAVACSARFQEHTVPARWQKHGLASSPKIHGLSALPVAKVSRFCGGQSNPERRLAVSRRCPHDVPTERQCYRVQVAVPLYA